MLFLTYKIFYKFEYFLQGWKVYDSNPKSVKCPLVCLPPVSGTADIFFKQILGLSAKGYRVISVSIKVKSFSGYYIIFLNLLFRLNRLFIGLWKNGAKDSKNC